MKKVLFNPFVYVAGTRALVIGWAAMLVTAVIAFYSHAHYDGVVDMHVGHPGPMMVYLLEQVIDWALPVLLLYAGGVAFSKSKIRFIDIAGTLALARWPMLLAAITAFGVKAPPVAIQTVDEAVRSMDGIVKTAVYGLVLILPFIVWTVALMVNAFKVSCNIKGGKAAGAFIAALLLSEIISKIIFYFLYKHFI